MEVGPQLPPRAVTQPRVVKCMAQSFDVWMPWDANPLYALLHESIYCEGRASRWAAHRVRNSDFSATFDAASSVANGNPVLFTGAQHMLVRIFLVLFAV